MSRWIIILKRKKKADTCKRCGEILSSKLIAIELRWYLPLKCSFKDRCPSRRTARIFTFSTSYYVVMSSLRKIRAFAFNASVRLESIGKKDFRIIKWFVFTIQSIRPIYRSVIEREKEREKERKLKNTHACETRNPRRQNFMSHTMLRLRIYRHPVRSTPLRFLSNSIHREVRDVISNFESSSMSLAEWYQKIEREREREREVWFQNKKKYDDNYYNTLV